MMLCQILGNEIAGLPEELPDEVTHASTRALVDWVAAIVSGSDHPATIALRKTVGDIAGVGRSSLIGTGRLVDPRSAALVNATSAHTIEVDDIYRDGIYHPGGPTIAAALAISQSRHGSGADLLRSIAIGYEVGCRIAAAVNPAHYRFWHTTGTIGTLGAAAGAGAALGLDADALANAIAISATTAAGLQQSFRSEAMAKPLHAGHAADVGVLAALSAAQGFTGALDILEGPVGLGAAMSENVDWERVTAPFGQSWAVTQVTFKNHTACGHTFAAIDATLALRAKYDLSPDDISAILVETAATPIQVAGNLDPTSVFEAKFSIPYCVASALLVGSVRLDAFSDSALKNPKIHQLVGRTKLSVDPAFDALFPNKRAGRVSITRNNGETVSEEAWTRRGDPEAPLSDDEISAKFIELTSPILGTSTKVLLDRLWATREATALTHFFEAG